MLRTDTVNVGAVRGDPQIRNAYGFAWNVSTPENTLSPGVVVLRAEVELEDGTVRRLTLRPGAWYGAEQLMTRVWLTSSIVGVGVFDWADDPKTVLTSSGATDAPKFPAVEGVYTNPGAFTYNVPASNWVKDFTPQAGVRTGAIYYRVGASGSAIPGAGIKHLDAAGTVLFDTDAITAEGINSLSGQNSQWQVLATWGPLPGANQVKVGTGGLINPVFEFNHPPTPIVRVRFGEQAAGFVFPIGTLFVSAVWGG